MKAKAKLEAKAKNPKIHQHPKLQEFNIEKFIGQGTYGKVSYASHNQTKEKVAIKFVQKSKLIREDDESRIKLEMKIMNECDHPNILKAYDVFEDETNFYMIMEYLNNGDLFHYICDRNRLTLQESTFFFYQIVNGIDYLHKKKIVHRDMKPENLLIDNDLIIKLGDFGLSRYFESYHKKLETNCGSPCYSAPEMLRGLLYYPLPIDIWGLGILLFIMVCGQLPFEGDNEDVLLRKVVHCDYQFPHHCNPYIKDLISKILVPDPFQRITLKDIKKHPVYLMGKANFIRKFKIYTDDGYVLPQVQEFIKNETNKYLSSCSIEINSNTENSLPFKIHCKIYLHTTQWDHFHIPSRLQIEDKNNDNQKRKSFQDEENNENNENNNNNENNKNKNRSHSIENLKRKEMINNLLTIPRHENFGSSTAMTNKIPKSHNKNKKLITNMTKLGMITHSFDSSWNYDIINPTTPLNKKNKNMSSSSMEKLQTTLHRNNNFNYIPANSNNKLNSSCALSNNHSSMNNNVCQLLASTSNNNCQTLNNHTNSSNTYYMKGGNNKDKSLKSKSKVKYFPSGKRIPFKI